MQLRATTADLITQRKEMIRLNSGAQNYLVRRAKENIKKDYKIYKIPLKESNCESFEFQKEQRKRGQTKGLFKERMAEHF